MISFISSPSRENVSSYCLFEATPKKAIFTEYFKDCSLKKSSVFPIRKPIRPVAGRN